MKILSACLILSFIIQQSIAQRTQQFKITTQLGKIMTYTKEVPNSRPIIFLHGVYLDHRLWQSQWDSIQDHTLVAIDMPLHGQSKDISPNWTLDDCSKMLIEIMDSLGIQEAIAIGHSWGSMTILSAASKYPERFQAIGLCNMPIEASSDKRIRQFKMQHLMLGFRNFYTKQAAKSLIGKANFEENPALLSYLQSSMNLLSKKEIRKTDQEVIVKADDSWSTIEALTIPAFSLKGKEDYVPISSILRTEIIPGGHLSPIEQPIEVLAFIRKIINLEESK